MPRDIVLPPGRLDFLQQCPERTFGSEGKQGGLLRRGGILKAEWRSLRGPRQERLCEVRTQGEQFEHIMFCLGASVTPASQPEPLVQKQSLDSTHCLKATAQEKVGGKILFHWMTMLSNFLSPWGLWGALQAVRGSPMVSRSNAFYIDKA